MMKEKISTLIAKYFSDTLTKAETDIILTWLKEDENNGKILEEYLEVNYAIENIKLEEEEEVASLESFMPHVFKELPRKRSINKWYGIVASVALFIGSFFVYYLMPSPSTETIDTLAVLPGSVGKDKAVLTLSNGEDVPLEEGNEYSYNGIESDGIELIYKNIDVKKTEYNYLTVPRGGRFFIELTDNTKIWLNSESQLKYPVHFIKGNPRVVELIYGEAYFEVSHSDLHNGQRFIVTHKHQQIEVLGTKFNLKAYKNDNYIETSLISGKIAISYKDKKKLLLALDRATINKVTKNINLKKIDSNYNASWKDGLFRFKDKPFGEVAKMLERWYDVNIIIKNERLRHLKIRGVISKFSSLKSLMLAIIEADEIRYKIEGKNIELR